MLRLLTVLFLALSGAFALRAQNVGDTAQAVEAALGRPQMARSTSKGDVWVYANGVKITFQKGVVTAVEGVAEEHRAVESDHAITVVPERTPPKPAYDASSASAARDDSSLADASEPPAWFWLCFGALMLISAGCNIAILIAAFRAGVLWGLGSLFVPFVSLIFVLFHWQDTKKPFLIGLGAGVASVVLIFKTGMGLNLA